MDKAYSDAKERFEERVNKSKNTGMKFTSVSGDDVEVLYTPDDLDDSKYLENIGFPGEFPFTRGIHSNGYRGKIWTMRQFAGFGTPEDTNKRFKYLLKNGQTGLSVAFDLPTLIPVQHLLKNNQNHFFPLFQKFQFPVTLKKEYLPRCRPTLCL